MKVIVDSWAWLDPSEWSKESIDKIRERLTVHPRDTGGFSDEPPPPIHLYTVSGAESGHSLGIARGFFLNEAKGKHEIIYRVSDGYPWPGDIKFDGTLEDDQERVVAEITSFFLSKSAEAAGGIIQAAPGFGKCLRIGTPVLLHDGRTVAVEDVRPGDCLMGPDSTPRQVLTTTRGIGPLYKITPVKGKPWFCNDAHILTVVRSGTKYRNEVFDISIKSYLQLTPSKQGRLKVFTPSEGVDFASSSTSLPVDPYFLGVWIGDGTKALNGVAITKPDPEIRQLCYETAAAWGLHVRIDGPEGDPTYHLATVLGHPNPLLRALKSLTGHTDKIPLSYLTASRSVRQALLAGILDTDGYIKGGCYDIVQRRYGYAEGIMFLARSLGIAATITPKTVKGTIYYRMILSGDFTQLPLRIPRRIVGKRRQIKIPTRTGFRVDEAGFGEYAGFTLDGDGRFCLGDFTVTHNTVCTLNIINRLKRPALILVHKGFLLRQWEERIKRFLPSAKVGIVQQDRCEFQDKHIVLAMVESLVARRYDEALYKAFGVVFSDETHRISAPSWSTIPPMFNARFRAGLTATPRRKDGAQNVFFYHIGPILAKGQTERMAPSIKRVWSGFTIPQYVTMNPNLIKKPLLLRFLCASKARNDKIVEQIIQAAKAGRKIMVLSERLDTHLRKLEVLFRQKWAATDESIPVPTTAFYIGGMKDEDYDEAEKAQVIFATSQLVQEGLDIPALDTMILTTPMSDIEQACVPGNTLIWSKGVPMEAKDIHCGDTLEGFTSGSVTKCWERVYSGQMLTIRGAYIDPLQVTPDHPIFIRPFTRKKRKGILQRVYQDPLEVPASAIEAIRCGLKLGGGGVAVGLPIWSAVSNDSDVTSGQAKLLGYFAAEGCISQSSRINKRTEAEIVRAKRVKMGASVRFCFGPTEINYGAETQNLLMTEFGLKSRIVETPSSRMVVVDSIAFAKFIRRFVVGNRAPVKSLTTELMSLPVEIQLFFIIGLVRGDGCLSSRSVRFGSSSHRLAVQTQMLLLRQGLVASMAKANHIDHLSRFSQEPMWELNLTGKINPSRPSGRLAKLDSGFLWVTVKTVTQSNYDGVVYNYSVSPGEAYSTTGGIVHNCGRIQRSLPGKKTPIIVDFRDDSVPIAKKLGEVRWKFYKTKNWVSDGGAS